MVNDLWVEEKMEPVREPGVEFRIGPFYLSIDTNIHVENTLYQHLSMVIGEITKRPMSECRAKWPSEAIALARKALDELEAKLEGNDG